MVIMGGTAGYMHGTAGYMVILGGTAGYIHGTAGYMVGGTAGYIHGTAGYMVGGVGGGPCDFSVTLVPIGLLDLDLDLGLLWV